MIGAFSGPILNSTINFPDYDFVHIVCYNKKYDIIAVEDDVIREDPDYIHNQIIPLIPRIEKSTDSDAPSVLLLAIDSMSFLNFRRLFTKTAKLLTEKKFIELKGYTKVGSNTFPNMVPLLTGYHSDELRDKYPDNVPYDEWPIIWYNYSKKGFVTAFVEETPINGLFSYYGKGFRNRPTDYETRPFHMEIRSDKYNEFCYKDRTETQVFIYTTEGKIEIQNLFVFYVS